MYFLNKFSCCVVFLFGWVCIGFSQTSTTDTIKNSITIVKPYTPSIQDAFKIKSRPSIPPNLLPEKQDIIYSIFSVPVASTFTPAKVEPPRLNIQDNEITYKNYLSLAGGSFTNILADVFVSHDINRTDNINARLWHNSSQGGIKTVVLDDKFYNTQLDLNYETKLPSLTWTASAGGLHRLYNWYGLPEILSENPMFSADTNVSHNFYGGYAKTDVYFEDTVFRKGHFEANYFADDFKSSEYRLQAEAGFVFSTAQTSDVNVGFDVDYLSSDFEMNYNQVAVPSYSNLILSASPNYTFSVSDFKIRLGAKASYLNLNTEAKSEFFIYPDVDIKYDIVTDVVSAFAGVSGGLTQNTYQEFATENPFVSPTLSLVPTNIKYKPYIGLKGKISQSASYHLKGSYTSAENQPLFLANNQHRLLSPKAYGYSNSFGVVYDDVNTVSIQGELQFDLSNKLNVIAQGAYFNYHTETQRIAWNLPEFKASIIGNYQISDKWFTGLQAYYVGERYDLSNNRTVLFGGRNVVSLNDYIDLNAYLNFNISSKFIIFAKANNILGSYKKWQNYPVQNAVFMGGLSYNFDF